jgi:SulP family sulfate permease
MLTGLQPQVREVLERSDLLSKIGVENCFETTTQAICTIDPNLPECLLPTAQTTELESLEV